MEPADSFLSRFIRKLGEALKPLIGEISWRPPQWFASVDSALRKSADWFSQHRKHVVRGTAAILAIIVVGGGVYVWYESLPKPAKLSFQGNSPEATRLEKDAKPDPINIRFSGSAARLDQVGKHVTEGIAIKPAMAGEWRWVSDTQLTFTPQTDWAVGQDYEVAFAKTLFPDHVRLDDYKFHFRSAPFRARIAQSEFYQDPQDPKIKKVVATLSFSHAVNPTELEKRITLRMEGQKEGIFGFGAEEYGFTVSYDELKGQAFIHSNTVTIPPENTYMMIKVDKGVVAAAGGPPIETKIEQKVWIPGLLNFFRIRSAELSLVRNEKYEPEQVLVIETTAGVQEEELRKNLEVFLLPVDRPAFQDRKAVKKYRWHSPEEIGPEILQLSSAVALDPVPADRKYATLHSFKYRAEVGRHLYIKLKKGIEAHGGYKLAKTYDTIAHVPEYPKELKIMHDGAILSLAGSKKLSVLSRGNDALRFQIGRVLPGQINHLISQTHGDFKHPNFSNYNFSEDNITERLTEVKVLDNTDPAKAQYAGFDFTTYLKQSGANALGLFFLRIEGWDPEKKRSTGLQDNRLILITDLGMVVKSNVNGSYDLFVQSLAQGAPSAGTTVEVLGKNGLAIIGAETDPQGHAKFPTLKDFQREKQPTVFIARRAGDVAFLPYDRRDRQLNLSRFDTGGESSRGQAASLSAFLFSDRGIYRPGDTFHVGLVVKGDDWRQNLAGIPLETVVTDARGLTVKKQRITLSAAGFEEITYTTEETSPTGNYQVNVYIVKDNRRHTLLGSTSVKVEEFLPDRLEISTRFSTERVNGWVSPENLKGEVRLKNLFGTPAINRRVAAEISLTPAYPAFRQYREYHFYDPLRTKKSFRDRLKDGQTDDKGEAAFDLDLGRFDKATYQLAFIAEGYEAEGGRGVSSQSTVLVSPLKHLIGYKPDGALNYLKRGSARGIHFVAVDPKLQGVEVKDLKLELFEQRYVSVLTRQPNGTFKYQSVRKDIPVSTAKLNIAAKGVQHALKTDQPGDYALILRDAEDVELNRVNYNVVGEANLARELEKNAELQVTLNKTDFSPGETIEMQIKAPYTGAGLITIERERVYAYKWFRTNTTSSTQNIAVPFDLEGNGYINVTFVRALDSREIFMSPLSYGVVPFSVSKEQRRVDIQIDTPAIARPGETMKLKYQTSRPARIAVFAVDEGILQVANYDTPDPLAHFFRKRALEVGTLQILDLLLPEFDLVRQLSAPGGGEDFAEKAIGKNLNPFKRRRDKPVAYWSGIIDADAQARELSYRVPDYFNGTLRVMAVAIAPDAVGATTKKSIVRGHFVLSPNVPTFVAPGDEFTVSVGVANNVEGSGTGPLVNLELKSSKHVEILDKAQHALTIAEGKEGVQSFKLRAKDQLGSGNLLFTAAMGDKRAQFSIDLSVRPPVPYMTDVSGGFIKSDSADVPVTRAMYPHYRTLEASASPLPLGLARGLVKYLTEFPYGCTEQLVSKAFPAIVLRNRPEFGYAPNKVENNLSRALHILQARQNSEGAFGFWAANSHVSDAQSVYAMHFLTHVKESGYDVPAHVLANGTNYLRGLADAEPKSLHDARTAAYAIYVLTRNGTVTSRYVASLRKHLDEKTDWKWKYDLAAAYLAATYQMLKLTREAESLIDDIKLGQAQEVNYAYFYDGLSRDSQVLYLLARHFPERLKKLSGEAIIAIAKPVAQGAFNTMSSAYTILALDAYVDAVGNPKESELAISEVLADKKLRALVLPKGLFPKVEFSDDAKAVRFDNRNPHNIFYQVVQAGFDRTVPAQEIKQKIEIQREYRDKDKKVVTETAIGDELFVHVKLRSVGDGHHSNVAVVDLLPGGFEVVLGSNPRSGNSRDSSSPIDSGLSSWRPQYVDIREDRVVLFGSVTGEAQEFVYKIKATNAGRYAIPPAFGESMYDRSVRSRALGATMTVQKAP